MNSFKRACLVAAFMACGTANAALVVGNSYSDSNGVLWNYVGSFRVSDGQGWWLSPSVDVMHNGLEAASLIFGALGANQQYATSTVDTGLVNHLAYYDGYGQTLHTFAEDIVVDINGNGVYNWQGPNLGDWSAYIRDHGYSNSNYVFKRTLEAVGNVPEPASVALMGLGLLGLAATRRKVTSR